jgi:hypothetical protein
MTLNAKEVIEKRDLLDGINPFIKWIIKLLVSRPAYYGILADSAIHIADLEIKGMALYELSYCHPELVSGSHNSLFSLDSESSSE